MLHEEAIWYVYDDMHCYCLLAIIRQMYVIKRHLLN